MRPALQLLVGATATNGPPSGATAGFPLNGQIDGSPYRWHLQDAGMLFLKSTAGSGVMTVTIRIWLYSLATNAWHPAGINATAALRGVLNDGNAIVEDGADNLTHAEPIQYLSGADRIYPEVVAIGGTSTAVDLYLVSCARQVAV